MKAAVICVGNEVLEGDTLNSDAAFVSRELVSSGFDVVCHVVVADDEEAIRLAIKSVIDNVGLIVTTGGLGPTKDDLTKRAVCNALGLSTYCDENVVGCINSYFAAIHQPCIESNMNSALMPKGCTVLKNDNGTAPGVYVEAADVILAMLPGPPRELEPMFKDYLLPLLRKKVDLSITERFYMLSGVGEGYIEGEIRKLDIENDNYSINTYLSESGVAVKARSTAETKEESLGRLIAPSEKLCTLLEPYLYYTGRDKPEIWEVVAEALIKENISISFAESLTGGLCASLLTKTPGVSSVFSGSVVTYTNEEKHRLLGVKENTLEAFGAVSHQTAEEMAEGAAKLFSADIGVSLTGIAGPTGGTDSLPVGLVWFGLYAKGRVYSFSSVFKGARTKVQSRAAAEAFKHIFDLLCENPFEKRTDVL